MDDWRPSSVLSSRPEERYSCSNKILAVGSGNVQTYALDTKEGVENQNPFQHSLPNYPSPKILPSHCAAPGQTLTSNDPQAAALRLIARRQRREQRHLLRPESDRRFYLTNKKYLDYRARHRRDTQADGKVVWSNLVEDAFQDGELEYNHGSFANNQSIGAHRANGAEQTIPAQQTLWSQRVDCRMDLRSYRGAPIQETSLQPYPSSQRFVERHS